jgi:hypothetical protein
MKLLADLEKEIALKDGPELDAVIDKIQKSSTRFKIKNR